MEQDFEYLNDTCKGALQAKALGITTWFHQDFEIILDEAVVPLSSSKFCIVPLRIA